MNEELPTTSILLAKRIAHQVWDKYDDEFGYRSEKQTRNDAVSTDNPNNIWFFWNQFDYKNQVEFAARIMTSDALGAKELRKWVSYHLKEAHKALQQLQAMGIML